jgi:F-type H+-transporting ATPase subunit b
MIGRGTKGSLAFLLAFLLVLTVFTAAGAVSDTDPDTVGQVEAEVAEAHDEEAHGGGHGGGGMTPGEKRADLLYRTMNFAALFIILFLLLRKPVGKFFSGRREDIAETWQEFQDKKAEAEAKFKELEGRLADLTAERERIVAEYRREGEEEREKIIAHAREMAARIEEQGQQAVEQEVKEAKAALMREIADASASMAEDMIKKNINEKDQERLVEEYLTKVVPS